VGGVGKVNITGLSVKNCERKSGSGKGGGIYLRTTDEDVELALSSLSFERNGPNGIKGKDVYVLCEDVGNVVKNKFSFMTSSIEKEVHVEKISFPFSSSFSLSSSPSSFFVLNGKKFSIEECSFMLKDISFFQHLSFESNSHFFLSCSSSSSSSSLFKMNDPSLSLQLK
jgi:hypothetical protein